MKDQLISFETAKLAKEKGFDEWCDSGYNEAHDNQLEHFRNRNDGEILISAPTQSLLQKWLREEYNIFVNVDRELNGYKWYVQEAYYKDRAKGFPSQFISIENPIESEYNNEEYEIALEDGLKEALKLLKTKH